MTTSLKEFNYTMDNDPRVRSSGYQYPWSVPSSGPVGEEIDKLCEARDWSYRQLARELEYDYAIITRIRSGRRPMTLNNAIRFLRLGPDAYPIIEAGGYIVMRLPGYSETTGTK